MNQNNDLVQTYVRSYLNESGGIAKEVVEILENGFQSETINITESSLLSNIVEDLHSIVDHKESLLFIVQETYMVPEDITNSPEFFKKYIPYKSGIYLLGMMIGSPMEDFSRFVEAFNAVSNFKPVGIIYGTEETVRILTEGIQLTGAIAPRAILIRAEDGTSIVIARPE